MNTRLVRTAAALCAAAVFLSLPAAAGTMRVGDDIRIDGDGDTVAIGGDVTVTGSRGDVAAMGGDIDITGDVKGDVGVAGGDVTIRARVHGDVGVAAGDFHLTREGVLEQDLGVATGEAVIEGTIKGNVGIAGGKVTVSGTIEGDLKVRGGTVTVADGGRIGGRLIVKGPTEPSVASGATVGGGVEYTHMAPGTFVWDNAIVHGGLFALLAVGLMSLALMAGLALVVGLFLVVILASFSERTVEAFRGQPLSSFAAGIGVVVLLPLAFVLLAATVIGIPLVILLAPLYPFWLLLGFVGGALGLSRLPFPDRTPSKGMQLLALFGALVVMALVALIPIVGQVLLTVLFLMGTGALTLALFRNGAGRTAPAAAAA